MREETVTVKIDHPLGSTDEDNPSVVYPINCGYVDVERTAGFSELDKQRVYLLGVDVAVDEYIGELIAVARRRDDPETVWIIAPENISYTIQQIEEMIYFEEQYYDSFVEIVDEELWDAYDENEKLLGFDLKRSQAKSLPDGVYHVIVNVYTMTKDGKLLTTERSRNKTYPLKWEVTGGSILKGETAAEGAIRELYEETGIKISTDDLIPLYSYVDKPKHAIYHSYLNLIEKKSMLPFRKEKPWTTCMFHIRNLMSLLILTDSFHQNSDAIRIRPSLRCFHDSFLIQRLLHKQFHMFLDLHEFQQNSQ